MSPTVLLAVVIAYFSLLLIVAWYTSRKGGEHAFYTGERKSLWWVVAFGMIGTSLTGVTFISVPGQVRAMHWEYLQMGFGYCIGYWVVAGILLPLYYRHQVTSIYTYLQRRLGPISYKTGSVLFLISRLLGTTIRIYAVLYIIHRFLLDDTNIPFVVTSSVVMLMIFLYTLRGGVKTIVWTDTLQTFFMLVALVGTILYILFDPNMTDIWQRLQDSEMTKVINTDWKSDRYFWKQIVSGIFLTIAMTGLDQEMMQKNLSVRTLADAQKNMLVFSVVLLLTTFLFLLLGALLYLKADQIELASLTKPDDLFPTLALQHFPPWLSLVFIVGLISALFPSADGALTALTASTCIDIIGIRERGWSEEVQRRVRKFVHLAIALLFQALVLWFYLRQNESLLITLLSLAALTYGPLLGLFSFGLFTKRVTYEPLVPVVCIVAASLAFFLRANSEWLFNGYQIGFETLILNGCLTFFGLLLISRRGKQN
jgi:Na+/proline symporter